MGGNGSSNYGGRDMMKQTMPEKLRLIAHCIEQGKDVQYNGGNGWHHAMCVQLTSVVEVYPGNEYRAKPDKPRVGVVKKDYAIFYDAVELTPEVRAALEAAGVEI
jgi:hypothetical protein